MGLNFFAEGYPTNGEWQNGHRFSSIWVSSFAPTQWDKGWQGGGNLVDMKEAVCKLFTSGDIFEHFVQKDGINNPQVGLASFDAHF